MKNSTFSGAKIAFFEPDADMTTNPSLMCLLEELTIAGASVDVFMPMPDGYPQAKTNFNIYPFPKKISFWSGNIRLSLNSYLKDIQYYIKEQVWRSSSILKKKNYDLVFGVNDKGLIKAAHYLRNNRTPIIYLSYEIYFWDELLTYVDYKEKRLEVKASQLVDLVVIQDERRAELLARENNIDEKKFAYLPVAPRLTKKFNNSQYLREKFEIPNEKIVVLHSGSFENWTYPEELLNNAKKWPNNVVLVIHTRYKLDRKDKYFNIITEQKPRNIILSTDPLDNESYEKMICSADIGLVLYKQIPKSKYVQKNIETIGLSSGKFSYYMKYGLPTIAIGPKTYTELLKEYKFGFSIKTFDEMSYALTKTISNYSKYSKEAYRLFSEKLAFDLYWPRISENMLELLD